jgi:FkbM family methyltransferase
MTNREPAVSKRRFLSLLDWRSKIRHVFWRLGLMPTEERVKLSSFPIRILLRRGTHDAHIAREIFQDCQYELIEYLAMQNEVRTIVDVGANVGFSVLYFACCYPNAKIICFEPVPSHVSQINRHIDINLLASRVVLHTVAVSIKTGSIFIKEDGAASAMVDSVQDGFPVKAVDWFAMLPTGQLDVVKIDIEGGEYDLLSDPRFVEVSKRVGVVFLEWHESKRIENARDWCWKRLDECGFEVTEGQIQYGTAGILKAVNREFARSY